MHQYSQVLLAGLMALFTLAPLSAQSGGQGLFLADALISSQIASREELALVLDSLDKLPKGHKIEVLTTGVLPHSGRVLSLRQITPLGSESPNMIGIIETILEPLPDARLRLYTYREERQGEELIPVLEEVKGQSPILPMPEAQDFFASSDGVGSYAEGRLRELLYPLRLAPSWDEGSQDLVIEASLPQSLEDKGSPELQDLIRRLPRLRYEWRDGAFRPKQTK